MIIKGLDKEKIKTISKCKNETDEVLDYRLKCYSLFEKLPLPNFGPEIKLDFDKIAYYKSSDDDIKNDWNDIKSDVKTELDDLGVIESEKHLDGIGVQYQSEVI